MGIEDRVARCGCGSSEMAMLEKVNGGMVGGSFFNQGFSHERMLFFRVFFFFFFRRWFRDDEANFWIEPIVDHNFIPVCFIPAKFAFNKILLEEGFPKQKFNPEAEKCVRHTC